METVGIETALSFERWCNDYYYLYKDDLPSPPMSIRLSADMLDLIARRTDSWYGLSVEMAKAMRILADTPTERVWSVVLAEYAKADWRLQRGEKRVSVAVAWNVAKALTCGCMDWAYIFEVIDAAIYQSKRLGAEVPGLERALWELAAERVGPVFATGQYDPVTLAGLLADRGHPRLAVEAAQLRYGK